MDSVSYLSFVMDSLRNWKISPVLQRCLVTLCLLAGAVLLEIRLIYAVFVSLIVNFTFHRLGITWKVVWKTVPRDFVAATKLIRLKFAMWKFARTNSLIGDFFSRNVRRHPDKAVFLYEDQVWSYSDMEKFSNQTAHFFTSHSGLSAHDTVALFLMSRPEYVGLWLGISKADFVASLVNYQLRGDQLLHSLRACDAKAIIVGVELLSAVEEIRKLIPGTSIFVISERGKAVSTSLPPHTISLDKILARMPTGAPEVKNKKRRSTDRLFYIYTSGTTGLPKAAIITHARFFYMAYGLRTMISVSNLDVLYCTLPLYHSAGGILGVGQALLGGTTVVIRKKFSASQFWVDCDHYKCTVAQYIGEICRYILAQKESPLDKAHKVRLMYGNGLREQIWEEFQKRFNVKQVAELYGATEGNASLINVDNTVGAVGFVCRLIPSIYPVRLIRVHPETGIPLRDSKGLCISCQPGEPGELVGKIQTKGIHKFDGYCNAEATKKKVAQDVFRRGDLAFLTGDILVMDDYGYLYFKDRTGDTFRWKGENVSTNEVEATIAKIVGLEAVAVFGVNVADYEGKAGMACITGDQKTHNLQLLNEEMKHCLPAFAKPLFIRYLCKVEETGTFKLIKSRLKEESFDPEKTGDDTVYYLDPKADEYKLLTTTVYKDVMTGKIRY